ncbi:hypothetical protein Patl1_28600 [Pistacia atlantica]|uniref:Uncharacterized protein n=1 Tax=Pistacia atlantica TaxID=434234 RepID=A0ACC1BFF9_9ROSI|nr:hypothetical protein Patl1_28600 [Pistacia atlantica]
MISRLLSLQESQPEFYTDEIIKGLILIMLLAGTETSVVTLEWVLSNLLNHPEVLKKARDELENQLGEHLMNKQDLSKLHYLQHIISETFRLYPAALLLVPHMSSNDCSVEGYDIPRKTMLLDDPLSFKPERFENGENMAHKLMPFGLGKRACPGAGLAQRVIGLTLSSLIQCFE